MIRIIWEMKFEVEFRLTIQFSLLLLDMKVRHQLPMDSVQVDLLPSFRESLMLTNFQVNEPGLSTRTPSQRQVNQLEFPAMLFQNRDKYFYPHNVVKRSQHHGSVTLLNSGLFNQAKNVPKVLPCFPI